jgi:hypothetical protein
VTHAEQQDDLVVVRTTAFATKPKWDALEANEVDAVISGDDAGGIQPGMAAANGIKLLSGEATARRPERPEPASYNLAPWAQNSGIRSHPAKTTTARVKANGVSEHLDELRSASSARASPSASAC